MENLQLADRKARRGKTHSYGVRLFDKNRDANLAALHEQLRNGTFKTSEYKTFKIYKPKERTIYRLPYFPDRIVHHAIMNVLEPVWMSVFTHNTFSCIKKRGISGCARYVDKLITKYNGRPLYCLKIDITKFYPSINHCVLKEIIRRKIKDEKLLCLLDEIIDSAEGLPIGNYLSQSLANLFLAYFMHSVNERIKLDCTEYADDMVFLSDSKETLRTAFFQHINPYIEQRLQLTIKSNWQIFPIAESRYDKHGRALDYVGYKFYRRQRLMRKSIKQTFCRKVARLNKRFLPISDSDFKREVAPWLGWAKHANSKHLLQTLFNKQRYDSIFH